MWILGLIVITATVVLLALLFLVGLRRLGKHIRRMLSNSDRPNILHGATFWLSGIFFIVAFVAIGFFWETFAGH
jgi:hypothetical protein